MSGKQAKEIRKLAKKELQKRMNPNQPTQQINIIEQLERFIFLSNLLTGEKPTSLTLTDAMYNAYVQTVQSNAEAFGLNPGFKTGDPTFMGVRLTKKSPVIVPNSPSIPIVPPIK